MPVYDYKCKECNHTFEKILKIAERDNPLSESCPNCNKNETVTRLIHSPMICYSNPGSLKTTDSFNDRLKEIKNKVPERYKAKLNENIR